MFTGPDKTSQQLSLIIAVSVSMILLTTIFFIFGCVCGQLWQKHKQPTETSDIKDTHLQPSQVEHASPVTDHTITAEQELVLIRCFSSPDIQFILEYRATATVSIINDYLHTRWRYSMWYSIRRGTHAQRVEQGMGCPLPTCIKIVIIYRPG